jgi:hypothetical protein
MRDSAAAVVSESSVILVATITSLLLLGGVALAQLWSTRFSTTCEGDAL